MEGRGAREAHYRTLARAMHARQQTGEPVHRWRIETGKAEDWSQGYRTVGQFMSTDLFTVRPEDLVDFAASVMTWRHIRHVPVEDGNGRLVGLISHRDLLRLLGYGHHERGGTVAVSEIMKADPVTVAPDTPTLEAIEVMRRHKVGCLPVVERLVVHLVRLREDFDRLPLQIRQRGVESSGGERVVHGFVGRKIDVRRTVVAVNAVHTSLRRARNLVGREHRAFLSVLRHAPLAVAHAHPSDLLSFIIRRDVINLVGEGHVPVYPCDGARRRASAADVYT
ncbi:MAG TPA: CBS domain-containing protein [Pyrinomonadaceae bacterium]|nr:CBS domain-containing protein [Pyrinomonadaceae bacterium]